MNLFAHLLAYADNIFVLATRGAQRGDFYFASLLMAGSEAVARFVLDHKDSPADLRSRARQVVEAANRIAHELRSTDLWDYGDRHLSGRKPSTAPEVVISGAWEEFSNSLSEAMAPFKS